MKEAFYEITNKSGVSFRIFSAISAALLPLASESDWIFTAK